MEPLGPPAGGRGGVAKIHKKHHKNRTVTTNINVIELRLTIKNNSTLQKHQGKVIN